MLFVQDVSSRLVGGGLPTKTKQQQSKCNDYRKHFIKGKTNSGKKYIFPISGE